MSRRETWFARNERAEQLEHEGKIAEAIDLYEANSREDCDIVFTYERLAVLLRKNERYGDAVSALDRAIELEKKRGPSERVVRLEQRRDLTADLASRPPKRSSLPQRRGTETRPRPTDMRAPSRKGCLGIVMFAGISLATLAAAMTAAILAA
jgi:tetratricopeptide (TPR) repeat protein